MLHLLPQLDYPVWVKKISFVRVNNQAETAVNLTLDLKYSSKPSVV